MRILVLSWRDLAHPQAGGAEVYLESVLQRWAGEHEVTLVAAAVDGAPADEVVNGYRVVRRGGRFGVYRAARRWYAQHGRGRFDLVVEAVNTVPFLAHEWVGDDTPTISLVHQTCEEIWHRELPWPLATLGRRVLEPGWLRRLGRAPVLAVSESTRAALARFGVHDVTVVPEGYEPSPEALAALEEPKAERPTVVWCARLVDYKRPGDVIAAVEVARREVPDLQAVLIGGGPMLSELRAQAPSWVHVTGRVDEATKHRLMASAHVHVATSVREGWGLVVSEAAAVGTPTLSYDVPGLRDSTMAAHGQLCPADPQVLGERLVGALHRWRAHPPAPLAHGGAHSWDTVARVVLEASRSRARVPFGDRRPLDRRVLDADTVELMLAHEVSGGQDRRAA